MESLMAGLRTKFASYFNTRQRYHEKLDSFPWSRVRFADAPFAGDTLRLILGAFDKEGRPIHMMASLETDPSGAKSLIALDMDPVWIRQAVARQCEDAIHSHRAMLLYTPPPADTMSQWLCGFTTIALGDTV